MTFSDPLYISRIRLKNVKCFREVDIAIDLNGQGIPWTVIVGDNASGKTALLKSIALGLCDESSAAGLMKESDEGYVRRNEQSGSIVLDLLAHRSANCYRITTTITRHQVGSSVFENLQQRTKPTKNFPWDKLFACAYGMGRGTGGTGDIAGYSVINAVYNLFNYGEGLQNPELTMRRMAKTKLRTSWLNEMSRFLGGKKNGVHIGDRGITVSSPAWGDDMPLRDLADGYRATFLWIADFFGWAVAYDRSLETTSQIAGVVIIDELEQHLHATWQRRIVGDLRRLFPGVQFITTTHSPFIATSIGSLTTPQAHDVLVLCEQCEMSDARAFKLPTMQTYRFEQVLASRAFKYLVESTPDLERAIKRASEIIDGGANRTKKETHELARLRLIIAGADYLRPRSAIERDIESRALDDLKKRERKALKKKGLS